MPSQSSTYDANDRLTSDNYDNNGNTISANSNTYAYDFENHLTSLNGNGVTYVYDGDGNRVAKTVGGNTTNYLVDTNNPTGYAQVVDELQSGVVVKSFTYGHDLISQRIIGGSLSFYGYDGHGSVRLLTDVGASVTDTYNYDAFGNLISRTGATPNDYLYSGEQFDANLGFYYLRARYLNSSTGRFWNADSYEGNLTDPQSLHKYLYTRGNPTSNIDPSGNSSLIDVIGVIATIGILVTISGSALLTVVRGDYNQDNQEHPPNDIPNAFSNYHAIEIVNSQKSIDEMFEWMKSFRGADTSVSGHSGSVTGAGSEIKFSINGWQSIGQPDFGVRIKNYDQTEHLISAVTLGGHPLKGYRYWRIYQWGGESNHFVLETGAVDNPARLIDYPKAASSGVMTLWTEYMQQARAFSQGEQGYGPAGYFGYAANGFSPFPKDYILQYARPR